MIRRILRIVKANIEHSTQKWQHPPRSTSSDYDKKQYTFNENASSEQTPQKSTSINQQVIDDLAYFGLKPPSSLKEVTAARNREMLKYHPDKFASDPEKAQYANEIALLYNTAFDRLKIHFSNQDN